MDHSEVKYFPKVDHTPAELDRPSLALMHAASWLEDHGLCRDRVEDGQGRGCVIHALSRRDFTYAEIGIAQERLTKRLGTNIVMWLLFTDVSQEEVIAKLRAVALSG